MIEDRIGHDGTNASLGERCRRFISVKATISIVLLVVLGFAIPSRGSAQTFQDVSTNYWAYSFVEKLASNGITSGCGGGNYCPESEVSRAQMAVFLLRAKHGSGCSPPAATGIFNDVPMSHWAVHWIEQLAAEGITAGCGGGDYCPKAPVTRDQMAVFLVRTFGL